MLCTCGFTESAGIESTHKDGCMKHRAESVEIGILGSRTSPLVLNKSHDESENKGLNFPIHVCVLADTRSTQGIFCIEYSWCCLVSSFNE